MQDIMLKVVSARMMMYHKGAVYLCKNEQYIYNENNAIVSFTALHDGLLKRLKTLPSVV